MGFLFHFNGISSRNAISHWKRIWQFFFLFFPRKKVSIWHLITQYATLTKGKKKKLCYYQKELVARYFYSILRIAFAICTKPNQLKHLLFTSKAQKWYLVDGASSFRSIHALYTYTTRMYEEEKYEKKIIIFNFLFIYTLCSSCDFSALKIDCFVLMLFVSSFGKYFHFDLFFYNSLFEFPNILSILSKLTTVMIHRAASVNICSLYVSKIHSDFSSLANFEVLVLQRVNFYLKYNSLLYTPFSFI